MFCEKCGSELPDHARFCAKCGNPVQDDKSINMPQKPEKGKMAAVGNVDLQKAVGDVKQIGTSAGKKLNGWVADYIQTWQNWKELQAKEKYIWFGIHGGFLLLLICIIAISKGGSHMYSMVKAVIKDGEVTEEDITMLVEQVKSYEDIVEIQNLTEEMLLDGTLDKYGFEKSENFDAYIDFSYLADRVWRECIRQSELESVSQYHNWYDQDKLREMLYGETGGDEKEESFSWDIEYGHINAPDGADYDADERITVMYYTYPDNNTITFVKTTETGVDDTKQTAMDVYEGEYTVSDAELVILLDGTEYHLTQADTDIVEAEANKFWNQAKGSWKHGNDGYWKGPTAFYKMFFPKAKISGSANLYLEVKSEVNSLGTIRLIDEELNTLGEIRYEQGEGTTVLFGSTSLSYKKQNGILILTVDGMDYEFTEVSRRVKDGASGGNAFEVPRSDYKIVEE